MMPRQWLCVLGVVLLAGVCEGQTAPRGPARPMPPDRVADSYAIYSKLMPMVAASSQMTSLAVKATTIPVVSPSEPCLVPPAHTALERAQQHGMNPHIAVTPPAGGERDYEELLADFDAHCHEQLSLTEEEWATSLPVRLLNDEEEAGFRRSRTVRDSAEGEKYKGSLGLYSFSEVYFNQQHTVAMVYAVHWCGGLCGQGSWVVFGKKGGTWLKLPWKAAMWVS